MHFSETKDNFDPATAWKGPCPDWADVCDKRMYFIIENLQLNYNVLKINNFDCRNWS